MRIKLVPYALGLYTTQQHWGTSGGRLAIATTDSLWIPGPETEMSLFKKLFMIMSKTRNTIYMPILPQTIKITMNYKINICYLQ